MDVNVDALSDRMISSRPPSLENGTDSLLSPVNSPMITCICDELIISSPPVGEGVRVNTEDAVESALLEVVVVVVVSVMEEELCSFVG